MNVPFCPRCGAQNPPAARFCEACGSRLPSAGRATGLACANCGTLALAGDRFCDECGAALPASALFILEGSGWRVPLPDRAESIVGREDPLSGFRPDVDLSPYQAEAYGVSRRHARLARGEEGYRLEDLGSVNLTYLNDQRLEPGHTVELKDGDRIVIGRLGLFFREVRFTSDGQP